MKYIIESNDVIGYTPKYAMLFGDGYMIQPLEDLEELNSDYINEHYGSLQDDAYQRGLDDAWEAAKKILQMYDFTVFGLEHDGVFESPLNEGQQMTPQEAIEKLKAYEEKQKAADEIKVGDEVDWDGAKFVVTRIFKPYKQKEQCDGVDMDGCVYADVIMSDLTKTGRHFNIDYLEEMNG